MIYRLIIGLLVLATLIYYVFCFLEIFGLVKFTGKNTTVKIPQMFIPFYYIFKKDVEPVVPEPEKDCPISVWPTVISVGSKTSQVSLNITDRSNHGWSVDVPSWVSLETVSGVGTQSVLMIIKRNSGKNTREGDITVTDITNGDVLNIEIEQKAKSAENPQVNINIVPGSYKSDTMDNYDLIWTVRMGNNDSGDILFNGQLGYPCRKGSSYNWGDNQWSHLIPESDFGSRLTIRYELTVVNYDNNDEVLSVKTGTKSVMIPSNPDGESTLEINLPIF